MNPHRAWAEIDLDALAHNLRSIRGRAGDGVRVMLVVKADAYGHGAVRVACHARHHGVHAFGVGTCREAMELRSAGVRSPLLVLGTIVDAEVPTALKYGVELGLHSSDRLRQLQGAARELGHIARVHLNVDTGMGRLGVLPGRAIELLREIAATPEVELAGLMTHITAAQGSRAESTALQLSELEGVLGRAAAEGLPVGTVHVANSAALYSDMQPLYHMVRPGLAAYGALLDNEEGERELRPVLSLHSQVVFLKDIPAGRSLGYGSMWTPTRQSRIASLSVGYADGVPPGLSRGGSVLMRGQLAPVVGQVSMDYTTIDVTDIPDARVGDVSTIVGRDGERVLSLSSVARTAAISPHALTCSIGAHVERIYRGGDDAAPALN